MVEPLAREMGDLLGWDEDRVAREIEQVGQAVPPARIQNERAEPPAPPAL